MAEALYLVGGSLATVGAIVAVIGAIGMLRFPDVYSRIHAAGVTDTGGATLLLLGLCLISGASLATVKLVIIWLFILLTSPAAAHALADAAYSSGHMPWTGAYRIVRGSETPPGGRER